MRMWELQNYEVEVQYYKPMLQLGEKKASEAGLLWSILGIKELRDMVTELQDAMRGLKLDEKEKEKVVSGLYLGDKASSVWVAGQEMLMRSVKDEDFGDEID